MATVSATIRVPRATRDRLAVTAEQRGQSMAALLTDVAAILERDTIFRAEREADRADADNPEVAVEECDWEAVLGDGLD